MERDLQRLLLLAEQAPKVVPYSGWRSGACVVCVACPKPWSHDRALRAHPGLHALADVPRTRVSPYRRSVWSVLACGLSLHSL